MSDWKQRVADLKPGDVASIICVTERDEDGVYYEVCVSLRSLAVHAFEEGEDQLRIWEDEVAFKPDIESAGARTWAKAREQEQIAAEVWTMTRGS
jgi:hypothetical protein